MDETPATSVEQLSLALHIAVSALAALRVHYEIDLEFRLVDEPRDLVAWMTGVLLEHGDPATVDALFGL